jgi:hypothetical protein
MLRSVALVDAPVPAVPAPWRRALAAVPLAAAVAALVGAGVWGGALDRSGPEPPAAVGTPVALDGAALRVDQVLDRTLANMPMSGPGMQMGGGNMGMGPGIEHVPEGFRRFTAELTIRAEAGGFRIDPNAFRAGPPGGRAVAPFSAQVPMRDVPAGSAVSLSVSFQVPEGLRTALLTYPGIDRPVRLALRPGPAYAHGGGADARGGGAGKRAGKHTH